MGSHGLSSLHIRSMIRLECLNEICTLRAFPFF
jgi:hypothetical protein